MTTRGKTKLPSRTVVLLDLEDRKLLQRRAEEEDVSASEVVRRSLRAYVNGYDHRQEEDQALRTLFAEMNAALDETLVKTREARADIRKNLDLIRKRTEKRQRAAV